MSDSQAEQAGRSWHFWARTHRILLTFLLHALLFAVAWFLAFGLAYNFKLSVGINWIEKFFFPLVGPIILIKVAVFTLFGLHRGWWRYVGMRDIVQICKATWVSFLIIWLLMNVAVLADDLPWLPEEFVGISAGAFPDSVFPLDFGITIALVCGARIAVRLYHEELRPVAEGRLPRLLILGAGNAAETAVRELLRMSTLQYNVVGFLDDNPAKHGAQIHGLSILGPISDVKKVCDEKEVDEILIAMPSATKARVRKVVELCQGTNIRFKTLPAVADLISGKASVSEMREVDINDVLGRDPVKLDEDDIARFIRDRVILVTGAGGSIGSEMCRQIALFQPRRLILVEQAEGALFEIDRELQRTFPQLTVIPYVADIADRTRMGALMSTEKPSAIFHAAAHKHVPMMERNPGEALKNNVLGTRVVADMADQHNVEKFVMISTDKAVNPTSIMGASKRVAEMYIQGLDGRSATQFVTVRFGNVLGSSGSVIPIFKEQIARGGPVTVTHPDMVRYFMTIPEAAQLVLQSASMGHGGEIFVLDMGEPVKIVDLARDLITLSGFRPDEDIEIKFVGLRPGEKLFEELAIEGEDVARTAHPKVGIWRIIPPKWDELLLKIEALVSNADTIDRDVARDRLCAIIPEFQKESPPSENKGQSKKPSDDRDINPGPIGPILQPE